MPVIGQKFVIVGGAGLLGSAVAHTLVRDHSLDVIICDQFGGVHDRKWANLPNLIADIWTPESLLTNLDKAWRDIAGVLVLADDGLMHEDADALFETAYHMPRRVWDLCVAKQRPLMWASSSHVYGDGPSQSSRDVHDMLALTPRTAFGRAKLAFDIFAARQGIGPDTPPVQTGLRLSSLYGSTERHKGGFASLPVQALSAARQNKVFPLWEGSETWVRDWCHADDAAKVVAALAIGQKTGFFDIGTGLGTSTRDLLREVQSLTGQTLDILAVNAPTHSARSLTPADTTPLLATGITASFRSLKEGLATL
jgi:nucleoside-diphosphate-sugar epimerase